MLTEDSVGPIAQASRIGAGVRSGARRRPRTKLRFLVAGLVVVVAIGYMIFAAMQGGSEYYVTTGELLAMGETAVGQPVKLGGRVIEGSVRWDRGTNSMSFTLTDGSQTMPVSYRGIVPDSFQPGNDVILEGKLADDGSFQATAMMAKCASKYEPARK